MADFRKSALADEDLIAIWSYIARDNPDAADRVVKAAYSTFQTIAQAKGIGRLRNFGEGIRSIPISGFPTDLVFYRETTAGVEIARVLHGARDLENLFTPSSEQS